MAPLHLLGFLLASPATACEGPTVSVASYNTWGLPFPIATESRRKRLPAIGSWLKEQAHDFVGLQEVWRGARGLLGMQDLFLPGPEVGDSGLAMYSPHPLIGSRFHGFAAEVGPDRWKRKGVLVGVVDHPDAGPVNLVVTHMQAGHGRRAVAARAAQADELAAIVSDLQGPTLVVGDLNFYADVPSDVQADTALKALGLVDAAKKVGAGGPTYRTGKLRLDRVYVRGGEGRCAVPVDGEVGEAVLSDHRPVEVDVRFGTGP